VCNSLKAWSTTAYAVASILGSSGSTVLVRGAGTRGALVLGSAVFVAGTVVCGLAPSMPVMIAGRALQGLGGGTMIAAVHGVVREAFPEDLWARMLATISAAWGIAALGGPAIGGVMAGLGVWRLAFGVLVPIAGAGAVLTWLVLRAAQPARRLAPADQRSASRVPFGRLLLICGGVLCIGSIANTPSPIAQALLVILAGTCIALMLRLDGAARARLFPAGMLSLRRPVGKGFWMIFLLGMSTTPGGVFIPLLMQAIHGVPPAAAGYLYATQSLSWTAAALLTSRVAGDRVRVALVLGPLLTASGFAGLVLTIGPGPVGAIVASLMLVGGGIGTCWAHVGTVVLSSGGPEEGAVAASMIPSAQLFAVSLGAALSGVIANAAGLASGASGPVAALAGAWLFGTFLAAPLTAFVIATRWRPATRPVVAPDAPARPALERR
jgi:predicted MFS family arabinose efflux permease